LGADSEVLREGVVPEDGLEIGRTAMGMGCPDDPQMSSRHARLFLREGKAFVEDMESTTGVWLRVPNGVGCVLGVDDQVWLGAQILLIRKREDGWEIRHHGPDGRLREKYSVPDAGVFLGRTSDLVLDKEDSRLSRRHAQIVREGDALRLYDRGAHNGTYLKLVEPTELRDGDEFRIATHRFRVAAVSERVAAPVQAIEEATVVQRVPPVHAPAARGTRDRSGEQSAEPDRLDTAQPVEEEKKKSGLAARLKRLGRQAARAPFEETAPVEVDSLQEDRVTPQARAPETGTDPSEEATVLVFHEESASEPEAAGRAAKPEAQASAPAVEMLGETLPPSTRRADLPSGSTAGAKFEILLEAGGQAEAISVPAAAGQTVLEAVQAAGLSRGEPLDWECGDGGCGVCVMGLVGGAEGLEPPDPTSGEMKTIQITEQVAPDPAQYRLACLARVRGNVRLRRL
jgi:pSer/pThr/pTyr-binding forkhead associated (FHA) protein/ferredoxin